MLTVSSNKLDDAGLIARCVQRPETGAATSRRIRHQTADHIDPVAWGRPGDDAPNMDARPMEVPDVSQKSEVKSMEYRARAAAADAAADACILDQQRKRHRQAADTWTHLAEAEEHRASERRKALAASEPAPAPAEPKS